MPEVLIDFDIVLSQVQFYMVPTLPMSRDYGSRLDN
jgi:hypothetical protein